MLLALTTQYINAFNLKNIDEIGELLRESFALEHPIVKRIKGKVLAIEAIQVIFYSCSISNFNAKYLYKDKYTTIISLF